MRFNIEENFIEALEILRDNKFDDKSDNKNFLARGIERKEEPEFVWKLTESRVVAFGYKN